MRSLDLDFPIWGVAREGLYSRTLVSVRDVVWDQTRVTANNDLLFALKELVLVEVWADA